MRIGRYEVIGELGHGGMATVALARSPTGSIVVLKRPLIRDKELCDRLRDEARTGLRLSHPHIVETLDLFEHEELPVLVVSYVSGASMQDLRQHGPLPLPVLLRVGRQIGEALDALHHATDERGRPLNMLHRDVTPGNIVLGHDGDARLIDLGIARSDESRASKTKTGCMRGTLRYLAPELFEAGTFSPASDLWSLGIVLLEAGLGRHVFKGNEAEIVMHIIRGEAFDLVKDELSPLLKKAVAPLLKMRPRDRPKRARDAAALFGMLEKDFDDTEAAAQRAVYAAVGPSRLLEDHSEAATRQLIHSAAATFCPPDADSLFDEEEPSTPSPRARPPEPSEPTRPSRPSSLQGTSPPALSHTQLVEHGPAALGAALAFPAPPRTPGEELLAYAARLRGFERSEERPLPPPPPEDSVSMPRALGPPAGGNGAHGWPPIAKRPAASKRLAIAIGLLGLVVVASIAGMLIWSGPVDDKPPQAGSPAAPD